MPRHLTVIFCLLVITTPVFSATFTVDSPLDQVDPIPGDGKCEVSALTKPICTLRAAVMEANALVGTDTISIPVVGTYTLTRSGTDDTADSGDLDINSTMVITATNGVVITRNSQVDDRIFHITASAYQLDLRYMTVSDGTASNGGNIYNKGILVLRDVTIQNGTASNSGGGIYNYAGVVRADTNYSVTFDSNHADGGGGAVYNSSGGNFAVGSSSVAIFDGNSADGIGGALYNTGVVSLANTTFSNNTADSGGGAIYSLSGGPVNVTASSFTNNTTDYNGGAIMSNTDLIITTTTFSGNTSSVVGGAICSHDGALSVFSSTFEANSSSTAGAIHVASAAETSVIGSSLLTENTAGAGALFINEDAVLKINNSTLSANVSSSGGAVYNKGSLTLSSVTAFENVASSRGGGLYNYSTGAITLRNTILAQNTATWSGPDCYNNGTMTSAGYNLIGDVDGCSITPDATDQYGDSSGSGALDPELDVLADNGGLSWTHALLSTSPAIDAGNPTACTDGTTTLYVDQRWIGYSRHVDGNGDSVAECDVGAFELQ